MENIKRFYLFLRKGNSPKYVSQVQEESFLSYDCCDNNGLALKGSSRVEQGYESGGIAEKSILTNN